MTVRINWFPDPNMANTLFKCVPMRCTVDFPTVSGFRWLRATTSGSGDIYAQYQLMGANLPQAGVYHIHSICYAQGSGALFRVYSGVSGRFTILYETGIADNQTKIIDTDITIPAGATQLLIRVVLPSTVGKFILIRDILLESKSTYATAVGGASGLLLRRHHATRLTPRTGTVVPDDGHKPMHDPILDHHLASRQVGEYHDRSDRAFYNILDQCRGERHGRHYLDKRNTGRIQRTPTCRLPDGHPQYRSGINELSRQVRQSDRHRDQYTHLHGGRISSEQDPARQHRIFRRGYDAARLTLMGVVA